MANKSNIRLVDSAEDRGRALARQTKTLTAEAVRTWRWGVWQEPAGQALTLWRTWREYGQRDGDRATTQGQLAHDVQYPSRLAAVIRAREDIDDPVKA